MKSEALQPLVLKDFHIASKAGKSYKISYDEEASNGHPYVLVQPGGFLLEPFLDAAKLSQFGDNDVYLRKAGTEQSKCVAVCFS